VTKTLFRDAVIENDIDISEIGAVLKQIIPPAVQECKG
jgi:hypothetical protein